MGFFLAKKVDKTKTSCYNVYINNKVYDNKTENTMKNMIIGTRLDYSDMNDALDRNVSHINQKFSKTLRKVAMDKGIKQTEQGARLEFYIVSDEEFAQFTSEGNDMLLKLAGKPTVRALISIDNDKMSANLQAVNSKSEYQGGMKYDVHQRYLMELREAMSDAVEKIGEDKNTRKKADAVAQNPYQVGDLVAINSYGKAKEYAMHRISKSGKKFVEIESLNVKGYDGWYNSVSAKEVFENVTTWGAINSMDAHGHFIPLKGNESQLEWKLSTKYDGKPMKVQWDKLTVNNDAEPGYYHDYKGAY